MAVVDSTDKMGASTESRRYGIKDTRGQSYNYYLIFITTVSTSCQNRDSIAVDSSTNTVHSCHLNGVVSGWSQSRDDGLCGSTS